MTSNVLPAASRGQADSPEERAHVTPDVRAVELPAIVEQPLTTHAVVESQCRIAEFRKEKE